MAQDGKLVNVSVTFKNMDGTDALKSYATEKVVNCVRKFVHHDTDVHVVLHVEKNRQTAEASFFSGGANFKAQEVSEDMYASLDKLVDSLTIQLRKHKERLTQHHA